jgi:hypothetical protein
MITQDHERLDFTRIPHSKGIGLPALIVLVTGLVGIFTMGGLSIYYAGYNHVWPAPESMRMPLGSMPNNH